MEVNATFCFDNFFRWEGKTTKKGEEIVEIPIVEQEIIRASHIQHGNRNMVNIEYHHCVIQNQRSMEFPSDGHRNQIVI